MYKVRNTLLTLLLAAIPASANTYTFKFSPNPADAYDLQHQNFYTWGLISTQLENLNLTSATLNFKNIYNWDTQQNLLSFDLLDTAAPKVTTYTVTSQKLTTITKKVTATTVNGVTTTVTSTVPNTTTTALSSHTTTSTKTINPSSYESTGSGILTTYIDDTGTGELKDQAPNPLKQNDTVKKTGLPTATSVITDNKDHSISVTKDRNGNVKKTVETYTITQATTSITQIETYDSYSWGDQSAGTLLTLGSYTDFDSAKTKGYSYTFTLAQLQALSQFLKNGGDFGISLDPDCHFYNDGITLTVTAMPEASRTIVLLGLSAIGLEIFRRRKAHLLKLEDVK